MKRIVSQLPSWRVGLRLRNGCPPFVEKPFWVLSQVEKFPNQGAYWKLIASKTFAIIILNLRRNAPIWSFRAQPLTGVL